MFKTIFNFVILNLSEILQRGKKMYINIAICDDEIRICNQLEEYISDFFVEQKNEFNIDIFTSGDSLCQAMQTESYDLIFLDIELPGNNGVQTGDFIRNILKNNKVSIVYISANQSYAMELFEIRPINFLVKPLTDERVCKVIGTFLQLFGEKEKFFTFKVNGHIHKAALSDILYFESDKRKVTVVTVNGSYEFYDSLKNVDKQVEASCFMMIHQSILVNFDYVKLFEYDKITMTDNSVLPISQLKRTEVRESYRRYIGDM